MENNIQKHENKKTTNERLENRRIFGQSELRIFYSYLEILSHFRWQ